MVWPSDRFNIIFDMERISMKKPFGEVLLGTVTFANGVKVSVFQIKRPKKNGYAACRVFDHSIQRNINHTASIPAAWRAVLYAGKVSPVTHRSTSPEMDAVV